MLTDARLVAGKDLRLEYRSRVTLTQVLPFVVAIVLLFGFAFEPDADLLIDVTPGLFWMTVLFTAMLSVQRSFGVESSDGVADGLRLSGMHPAGIYLGKAAAVFLQLLALEVVLGLAVSLLYGTPIRGLGVLIVTALLATAALAGAGTMFGVLAAGLQGRETLLPLLFLPAVAPVLIAASQSFELALAGDSASGLRWSALLALFATVYVSFGALAFGPLLEES